MSDGSLAEQLVQAAYEQINKNYPREGARAAVVAVLARLAAESAGYPELVTTDELLALADEINPESREDKTP